MHRPLPKPKKVQHSSIEGRESAHRPRPKHSVAMSTAEAMTKIRRGNFRRSRTMSKRKGISKRAR